MNDDLDRMQRLHRGLLGSVAMEMHDGLYRAFPAARGYSSRQPDDILFEAVLILALFQARRVNKEKDRPKVYFLVPAPLEGWVTVQLKGDVRRIFKHLKSGGVRPEAHVNAVKEVGALFHQIMLGSQAFALPHEPERWVAFGFSKSDPVPDWMSPKLLDIPAKGSELSNGV